jgi:hypothetical protein
MKEGEIRVLLVGESTRSFQHLAQRLERRHCRCRTATSYNEAKQMIGEEVPDIVLSTVPPHQVGISALAGMLTGTEASFFHAHPVEDSCWWLPALRRGEPCFGTPALRPGQFTSVLDRLVEEIRAERPVERPAAALLVPPRADRPARGRKPALVAQHKMAG